MKTKEFIHKEKEVCKLCEKEIDTDTEEWIAVIEYYDGSQTSIALYHKKCLNDLMKGKGDVVKNKFEERLKDFISRMFPKGLPQFKNAFSEGVVA